MDQNRQDSPRERFIIAKALYLAALYQRSLPEREQDSYDIAEMERLCRDRYGSETGLAWEPEKNHLIRPLQLAFAIADKITDLVMPDEPVLSLTDQDLADHLRDIDPAIGDAFARWQAARDADLLAMAASSTGTEDEPRKRSSPGIGPGGAH